MVASAVEDVWCDICPDVFLIVLTKQSKQNHMDWTMENIHIEVPLEVYLKFSSVSISAFTGLKKERDLSIQR